MTVDGVTVQQRDRVLVLTLANPPSNALTPGVRKTLLQALLKPGSDCLAIVLTAEGPGFSSGLPIDPDAAAPSLAELCRVVADCTLPVVAVLQGLVMGPGAELALAAHARLAASDLRMAFPEIALGLSPGGGASQRLPRLIGAEAALQLLLSGRAVAASEALSLGLVDGVTDNLPLLAALRLAQAMAGGQKFSRPARQSEAWPELIARVRREQAGRLTAGQRIVDCVEAALLLPVENGLAFEAVVREDLEQTAEAAALRAAARAERRAAVLPLSLERLRPMTVERIGLNGAGPVLTRLAVAALRRGLAVTWVFPDDTARASGLADIDRAMGEPERSRLLVARDPAALRSALLQVHERPPAADLLRDSLLGTAHLVLGGSEREMGLGLAPAGQVVELAAQTDQPPPLIVTAVAALRRIGLPPVLVGARPVAGERLTQAGGAALGWMAQAGVPRRLMATAIDGFGARLPEGLPNEPPAILRAMPVTEVLNRWLAALANEGLRLLEEGIARRPSDIDHLLVAGYGFPRWRGGPMHQADRRGLMVLRHDLRSWAADAAVWEPSPLLDRLIRDARQLADLDA
jgi:3-hydroxyacyl-CoA dehydrogenase